MKSKELIRQLQETDPSGEMEVCIDSTSDIYYVEDVEAYYDGCLQVLERDTRQLPTRNNMKITASGRKLRIVSYDVQDVICDNPDINIIIEGMYPERKASLEQKIEAYRQEVREARKKK